MNARRENVNVFVALMLVLGIVSLFVENGLRQSEFTRLFTNTLDYLILLLIPLGTVPRMKHGGIFSALFHSVSAFCNAGFPLFTENLAGFSSSVLLNLTIAFLIILGGLGFSVLSNLFSAGGTMLKRLRSRSREKIPGLTLNTKVVVLSSGVLVLSGTLLIYALEHGNTLISYPIGTQYLASFFQSVSLRTAGFNTIEFSRLNRFTYLLMMLFMFIGGASGSTAGGVKVNTIVLIGGYIRATVRDRDEVTIFSHSIAHGTINKYHLHQRKGELVDRALAESRADSENKIGSEENLRPFQK